jgi:hypothetical protein
MQQNKRLGGLGPARLGGPGTPREKYRERDLLELEVVLASQPPIAAGKIPLHRRGGDQIFDLGVRVLQRCFLHPSRLQV